MNTAIEPAELLHTLLAEARRAGADAAECSFAERDSLSVDVRLGALEGVEREETRSIALRAFVGRRQAGAASSDVSRAGIAALAQRVVAMARAAPEDPYCGLLAPEYRAGEALDLDLIDAVSLDPVALEARARAAEDAALAVEGVTNSIGAGASQERGRAAFATSDGFFGEKRRGAFGLGVSVLAERDGVKERDYEGWSTRHLADMPGPEAIGRVAGERTAAKVGARKIDSAQAPVLFDRRVAGRLIGPMVSAIAGPAVARGVSFLKDRLGQRIFPAGFEIEDEPLRPRGMGSRAFDGEGGAVRRTRLVEDGVLTTWLLNAASARQLGLAPTGHATGGHGGPPGVGTSNVTVKPGGRSPGELMRDAGRGLLVCETFSPSLNANTGDWSVGVAGYWFENGEVAFPVSEVTVAGSLLDIFGKLAAANDLERRSAFDSPSLLVEHLTIAGK